MYKKTIIENEKELLRALSKVRQEGDDFPSIKEIDMTIDSDGIFLTCSDEKFDISEVSSFEFLQLVLKRNNINLTITGRSE